MSLQSPRSPQSNWIGSIIFLAESPLESLSSTKPSPVSHRGVNVGQHARDQLILYRGDDSLTIAMGVRISNRMSWQQSNLVNCYSARVCVVKSSFKSSIQKSNPFCKGFCLPMFSSCFSGLDVTWLVNYIERCFGLVLSFSICPTNWRSFREGYTTRSFPDGPVSWVLSFIHCIDLSRIHGLPFVDSISTWTMLVFIQRCLTAQLSWSTDIHEEQKGADECGSNLCSFAKHQTGWLTDCLGMVSYVHYYTRRYIYIYHTI